MSDEKTNEIDFASLSQLVIAARDGDAEAHSEICRHVQGPLNRMAAKQLNAELQRKLNPSDIVQVTMTRMIQGFSDFRGSSSAEFYGWLNSILKNELLATRRNLQRKRRDIRREVEPNSKLNATLIPNCSDSPAQQVQQQEKLARFNAVIKKLSPDYAEVIELRSIQELPFEEVAKRMNRSVNAANKLWSRAIVALQNQLSQLDDSISP